MCLHIMVTHYALLLRVQPSPFSSAAFSILKITSMTAGDFSFNTILGFESDGTVSFPAISYIVWLLFLIVMPILFSNLLVSEKILCTVVSWSTATLTIF